MPRQPRRGCRRRTECAQSDPRPCPVSVLMLRCAPSQPLSARRATRLRLQRADRGGPVASREGRGRARGFRDYVPLTNHVVGRRWPSQDTCLFCLSLQNGLESVMSTSHPRRAELFVLMQLRRLGLGRNPLRRRGDRLEAGLLMTTLLAALLVVPAAAAVGTTISNRAERSATAERAKVHPVRARTLENTAGSVPASPGLTITTVRVGWLDSSGAPHEGKADVLIGTTVGTELTIWLDQAGAITDAPRAPADDATVGIAVGLTIPFVAWPMLLALFLLARRPLDRRRAEQWAREWEQVSPRWTRPQN